MRENSKKSAREKVENEYGGYSFINNIITIISLRYKYH